MPFKDPEQRRAYARDLYARSPERKESIVESNRRRRKSIRNKLRAIKAALGCSRCGFNECPEALEFHHRDPSEKIFALGSQVAQERAWESVLAEIEKCDLFCANCHRMAGCSCGTHASESLSRG